MRTKAASPAIAANGEVYAAERERLRHDLGRRHTSEPDLREVDQQQQRGQRRHQPGGECPCEEPERDDGDDAEQRRHVVRGMGSAGYVGDRQPDGKQVKEIRLHGVDARVHLDAARKQVEHAQQIPFALEDRFPVRRRHQVEQGLGMDKGVMPGDAAADVQVHRAVTAIEQKLAGPRRQPGGKPGYCEEGGDCADRGRVARSRAQ